MEKEKRKAASLTTANSFWRAFKLTFMGLIAIVALGVTIVMLFWLLVTWDYLNYSNINLPLIQEAVRNQCGIDNYLAEGVIDDSSESFYYDWDVNSIDVRCTLYGERWQCTCTERDLR